MGKSRSAIVFNTGEEEFDYKAARARLIKIGESEFVFIKKLQYNFVSREIIHKINRDHLAHDYETDVITFNYCEGNQISGEVYLCPAVISDNAKFLDLRYEDELMRVVIHGLLHLVGYDDQTADQKNIMTNKEEEYLKTGLKA